MTLAVVRRGAWGMLVAFVLAGCAISSDQDGTPIEGDSLSADVVAGDVVADVFVGDTLSQDLGSDTENQDALPAGDALTADGGVEDAFVPDVPPPFEMHTTFTGAPSDPLAGTGVESCGVYQAERCEGGVRHVCDLYDTGAGSFVDDPDPLAKRVFLYDRWYDLYDSPEGLTAERVFTEPMPAAASEETWGDPAKFNRWAGLGDAGIWTGAALSADAFRYMETGTEADYARMEAKTRTLLQSFDVTGVPGYLSRYHFLLLPTGSPKSDKLILRYGDASTISATRNNPIDDPASIEGLPEEYLIGVDDGAGGRIMGTPMWNGHTSIDQNTGPMMAFPLVYPLLRDDSLKQRIVHHMTCYLNRLQRVELRHVQDDETLKDLLAQLLGVIDLNLDPDDIDLTAVDRVVVFVHRGMNAANRDTFDRSCPDGPPTEPDIIIDAHEPGFLIDVLALVGDLNEDDGNPNPNQIDHLYAPNLRGGDASHMLHLASMVYAMTGDERYRDFLMDDLVGELRVDDVALTMQAVRLPDWCLSFYGDHITYGTHWQLTTTLPDGELKDKMIRATHEEMWEKALHNHHNAKFDVMYAATVPEADHPDAYAAAVRSAQETLRAFGGDDGVLDSPRRTVNRTRQSILDAMPDTIGLRCPTEEQRAACEDGSSFLGIEIAGKVITHACEGVEGECPMENGTCADALTDEGLPPTLRQYADFMWQRSPFRIGDPSGGAYKQSPGRDLAEAFWMARYYGLLSEGAGQVLAWREDGVCE